MVAQLEWFLVVSRVPVLGSELPEVLRELRVFVVVSELLCRIDVVSPVVTVEGEAVCDGVRCSCSVVAVVPVGHVLLG